MENRRGKGGWGRKVVGVGEKGREGRGGKGREVGEGVGEQQGRRAAPPQLLPVLRPAAEHPPSPCGTAWPRAWRGGSRLKKDRVGQDGREGKGRQGGQGGGGRGQGRMGGEG